MHDIYESFDNFPSLETRSEFVDMSKAFDRVWREGLINKLKTIGVSNNLLTLCQRFLDNRYQKVLLDGQNSHWELIKAGVPQESILGPLLFLIYINDLPNNLIANVKLFADDISIFSIVNDINIPTEEINNNLKRISKWAYQWKMMFNPDLTKEAQEVIFSRKTVKPFHPQVFFNEVPVERSVSQKHLGLHLDQKLDFSKHSNEKISKAQKGISVIKLLDNILSRNALLTIYKSFVRPHLDYSDIVYDQPKNQSFSKKIEAVQYNVALAITNAIKGTSRTKLYKELGIESLSFRRWFRRLCTFYKIKTQRAPKYLYKLIPLKNNTYDTRSAHSIGTYFCRTNAFKYSFFPYTIREWNKLDLQLLKLGRPTSDLIYEIHHALGLKLLTRLRLGLSHLNEHRFKHNFKNCINPLCTCSLEVESTKHFSCTAIIIQHSVFLS